MYLQPVSQLMSLPPVSYEQGARASAAIGHLYAQYGVDIDSDGELDELVVLNDIWVSHKMSIKHGAALFGNPLETWPVVHAEVMRLSEVDAALVHGSIVHAHQELGISDQDERLLGGAFVVANIASIHDTGFPYAHPGRDELELH